MQGFDLSFAGGLFRKRSKRDFYSLSGGQRFGEGGNNRGAENTVRAGRNENIDKQNEVTGSGNAKTKWVILGLTLVITASVYINWRFMTGGGNFLIAGGQKPSEDTVKYLGESKYVSSESDSYFDNAKYLRKKNRDEAVAVLSQLIDNANADGDMRKEAAEAITDYAVTSEREQTVENLIRAKGFRECIVFIGTGNATVVVETEKLTSAQAAQIMDIVASETNFSYDVIKIIEIGSVQN